MRENRTPHGRLLRSPAGWLAVGALLLAMSSGPGCTYNDHTTFGATEKWVASDVQMVPKWFGTLPVALFDSIFAPFFTAGDFLFRDVRYHPDYRYLTYSGSRVIGRADMAWGYKAASWIFSIPIETVWLLLTAPVDFITILVSEDSESEDYAATHRVDEHAHGSHPEEEFEHLDDDAQEHAGDY